MPKLSFEIEKASLSNAFENPSLDARSKALIVLMFKPFKHVLMLINLNRDSLLTIYSH